MKKKNEDKKEGRYHAKVLLVLLENGSVSWSSIYKKYSDRHEDKFKNAISNFEKAGSIIQKGEVWVFNKECEWPDIIELIQITDIRQIIKNNIELFSRVLSKRNYTIGSLNKIAQEIKNYSVRNKGINKQILNIFNKFKSLAEANEKII